MRETWAMTWLALVYGLLSLGYLSQADEAISGIMKINTLIAQGDFASLCPYITCQLPFKKEECPEGTLFTEGVAQYGCCGACVRFKQFDDVNCTGSINGGYSDNSIEEPPGIILEHGTMPMTNVLDSQWCDHGLHCDENVTCVRDLGQAPCKRMQETYDQSLIQNGSYEYYRDDYRWRPQCTPEGDFSEKQCKGPQGEQRCVCVDPQGNTVFGKAFPEQGELFHSMNCKCSRKVWERQQAGERSVTLHCQVNGNYEPLQCDEGYCYCLDPATGIPFEPVFPELAKEKLRCFNESLVGAQYLRRCESEYHAHMVLKETMEYRGSDGPETWLKCDPDGSYNAEQLSTGNNLIYCFDRYNEIRDPFAPANGGCNCYRDRWLFADSGVNFPYQCAPNTGTYAEKQVVVNRAFCFDAEGIRNGPMVYAEYKDLLICENAQLCQAGDDEGSSCEEVCMKEDKSPCDPEYYVKFSPSL